MFAAIIGQSWAIDLNHRYNLEINGIDLIESVQFESISLDLSGPASNGALTFTITDPTSIITVNDWDHVRFIEHGAPRPVLFGGFVMGAEYHPWAAGGRQIIVQCVGYGTLLDRKVVTHLDAAGNSIDAMGVAIQRLIATFGGILQASAVGVAPVPLDADTYILDVNNTIWGDMYWLWDFDGRGAMDGLTLRDAINNVLGFGQDQSKLSVPPDYDNFPAVGGFVWVDSYARVHAFWDDTTRATGYDGDAPVSINVTGSGGTVTAREIQYEKDGTDRITSAYVVGDSPTSSRMSRGPAIPVAGDLEVVVSDSTVTSGPMAAQRGLGVIARSSGTPVRSGTSIQSSTPIDFRPMQRLLVTFPQFGLVAEPFRIASVGITFTSSASRTYHLEWGGSLRPSMVRTLGRFQTRQR